MKLDSSSRLGRAGRDPRLWLLNCTSSPYCLSFRHLRFLSLGSKVTANFPAIHTSHKRSGNNALRAIESEHSAALVLGRLPLQSLPRLEKQTVLGEPEITPFAAERRGGGAGVKAGRAGHGVERATFTGPGVSRLRSLGAWLLVWWQGSQIPTLGGGSTRVSSQQAGELSFCFQLRP